MKPNRVEIIRKYFSQVKNANKESVKREAFKDMLNRLYSGDPEIEKIIDDITKGAETNIANIPRKDKLHRGSADTLFNQIIIEYENSFKGGALDHAKEQLAGYLLGQHKSGKGYNYTLIATDFIEWKKFSPDVSCLDKLDDVKEDELILNEVKSSSFVLTEENVEDFYYWIDRILFREEKQLATLERIQESFGYESSTFIECYRKISSVFSEAKAFGEVQVSYEQWKKYLSIAYGSYADKTNDFVIHTYLSVFSKMIAYEVISRDEFIDDTEMLGVLDGSIFHRYNIQNFIDNDFFHWVKSERSYKKLKNVFRLIAQELSSFDFNNVDEDILKGVYQELIDLDTRHALGEYYTPDWLCERIVNEFHFKHTDKILDPSCGSGSFLRAAIHRMKELNPGISVEELSNAIYGIDIHPLSVQIAKTTMLVALGKEVANQKKPIHLNIILANTLLAPEGVKTIFGGEFEMLIDKEKTPLNTQILEDIHLFDEALEVCEELAEQTVHKKLESQSTFENILKKRYVKGGLTPQVIDSFHRIYEKLKRVKEMGRDSIWKFIVQNLYKPYFLYKRFDYVIGNPPWFTYSSVKNLEYQAILMGAARKYDVLPESQKNIPNIEIAAIFLAYCVNYFLNPAGKLGFVLPRSFFSADHHDNTRSGKVKGIRLTDIWDMNDVSPLFRIPSGVLFAERASASRGIKAEGLEGISFSGNLPDHNCNYSIAKEHLSEDVVRWYYIRQGKSSAFSNSNSKSTNKINPYKKLFKRGAEMTPRNFYFVDLVQDVPSDWEDRIINVKTADSVKPDAKAPWKGNDLSGRIESRFFFRTALSKSILPFALYKPDLVVLPIIIETNKSGEKEIQLLSVTDLMRNGYMNASRWFQKAENIWAIHRTEKNEKHSAIEYLNWNDKLTSQKINLPYLVIYNASAKDANATVVERSDFDLDFFVDTISYVFYAENIDEAHYLVAILNSSAPNALMKDFQSRGLFGARHVHKKILDIYYPKYNEKNSTHTEIAELSKRAHEKAKEYLIVNAPKRELNAHALGRLRLEIKKHLANEMMQIDELVRKLIV